jgi:hypothetical protein
MATFQARLEAFIEKVSALSYEDRIVPSPLMDEAASLLSEFESLFGDKHSSITGLRDRDPGYRRRSTSCFEALPATVGSKAIEVRIPPA